MEVIKYIKEIPYGKTITYDDIARKIAKNKNIYFFTQFYKEKQLVFYFLIVLS